MNQIFIFFTLFLPLCAFAQVNESFNNPEITANYPWEGDLDRFETEDGFLRLMDAARKADAKAYLYGATLTENEWTFRIKSGYTTTNDNYFRVYLWSNSTDLDFSQEACFVELGKGQKKIALCVTSGYGAVDTLASRVINNLNDAFDLHIKVVADSNGQISLFGRSEGKAEYTHIGTSHYSQRTTPGYFMLYCRYSSGHTNDKYFGPVSIKNFSSNTTTGPEEEEERLKLLSIRQEDASTLNLTFNNAVDPAYASFTLNALGEADAAYVVGDGRQLRLEWNGTMEKGKTYTLSYADLYDYEGNAYSGTLQPFVATYETPELPPAPAFAAGDIIISEVMANPKGAPGLPETEYVELHNTTGNAISLLGWSFLYGDKGTSLKSTIPAGGYAVLYRSGRDIQVDQGGISIPLSTFPAALVNTGRGLSLLYNQTNVIDEIAYPSAKAGYSWERTGDTWQASTDSRGGTPGAANSVLSTDPGEEEDETDKIVIMPGEIIFSELLPEPDEGGSEYIELYNRSQRGLPLAGLAIAVRRTDGTLSTVYPLSSITGVLESGEYALLSKDIDAVYDFFQVSSPEALYELKLPVLNNVSSQLVLFRNDDKEVIDEVHYSNKWHSPSVKDKKGVALERVDMDGDSQDPDNWTSASTLSGGGTPGYKNSQSGREPEEEPETPTGIEAPEYTPAGNYAIAYRLDKAGYMCRASIFDTSGRRVAEVVNHELFGTEGTLTWDGYASGGNKLHTGVYIFHAELYHPQGGRRNYKKVFLVR